MVFLYSGYEVCGMENVPDDSPALIIYYHGAVPVDVYYFLSKVMLFKNRMVHTVADRFLFKIPGACCPICLWYDIIYYCEQG